MRLQPWFSLGLSSVIIFVAAACGKNGESLHPLDAAQKEHFRETVTAVGRASLAATAAGKGMSRVPWSIASDGARTRMVDRLKTALSQRQCRFHEQTPTKIDGKDPKSAVMSIALDGEACPIAMSFTFGFDYGDLKGATEEMTKTIEARYAVRDEEFRRLNDVDAFAISGKNVFRVDLASGQSGKMAGTFDFKGSIHSQAQGDLSWTVGGKVEAEGTRYEGDLAVTVRYPTYVAELRQTFRRAGGGWEYHHYLNGEEIDRAEYRRFLEGGGPVFQQLGSPNKVVSDLKLNGAR